MAGEAPISEEHQQRLNDRLEVRARIKARLWESLVTLNDTYPEASDDYSKAYICLQDVEKAWSERSDISLERALYPNTLSPDYKIIIQKKFLVFLSILVWLDAHAHIDRFGTYVFDSDGSTLCANEQLPLRRDRLPAFNDQALQMQFQFSQFIFTPVRYLTIIITQDCNS